MEFKLDCSRLLQLYQSENLSDDKESLLIKFIKTPSSTQLKETVSWILHKKSNQKSSLENLDFLRNLMKKTSTDDFNLELSTQLMDNRYDNHIFTQDRIQSLAEWYNEKANQGHSNAMNNLGVLYFEGHIERINGTPNYDKAAKWYQLAADEGHEIAMINLGALYHNGYIGIQNGKPNYGKAIDWFHIAADKGQPDAMYNLGIMYFTGETENGKPNHEKAVEWFHKHEKALECFNTAIESGHEEVKQTKEFVLKVISENSKNHYDLSSKDYSSNNSCLCM